MISKSFVVVGNGSVVKKYWKQAVNKGKVKLEAVVGREAGVELAQEILPWNKPNQVVVLATPTKAKCAYLTKWLAQDKKIASLVLVEKPYFVESSWHEKNCRWLSTPRGQRIRLLSQYSQTRAAILYPRLLDRPPKKITGKLVEGMSYYQSLLERWRIGKQPAFISDGPELDLGFHLIAMILRALRPWKVKMAQVIKANDLASKNHAFRWGEGFEAKLKVFLNNGAEISVYLTAGKYRGETERYLEFDYGRTKIRQEYSQEWREGDPVVKIIGKKQVVLAKQAAEFNYYLESVKQLIDKPQTISEKKELIWANQIAMDCRLRREQATIESGMEVS